jgi:hypothetical protein
VQKSGSLVPLRGLRNAPIDERMFDAAPGPCAVLPPEMLKATLACLGDAGVRETRPQKGPTVAARPETPLKNYRVLRVGLPAIQLRAGSG